MKHSASLSLLLLAMHGVPLGGADASGNEVAAIHAEVEAVHQKAVDRLLVIARDATKPKEISQHAWALINWIDPRNKEAVHALREHGAAVEAAVLAEAHGVPATITAQNALVMERLVKTGRYTAEEWDAFPGKPFKVDARRFIRLPFKEGSTVLIVPHPTQTWWHRLDFNESNWRGVDDWTVMSVREGEFITPVESRAMWKVPKEGLDIGCSRPTWEHVGFIDVKIYEVIP